MDSNLTHAYRRITLTEDEVVTKETYIRVFFYLSTPTDFPDVGRFCRKMKPQRANGMPYLGRTVGKAENTRYSGAENSANQNDSEDAPKYPERAFGFCCSLFLLRKQGKRI